MRLHILKRISAFALAFLFLMSCAVPVVSADGDVSIRETVYKDGIGFRVSMADYVADVNDFRIEGPDGDLTILSVSDDGGKIYTIVTEEAIDVTAVYTLYYGASQMEVEMPIWYSTDAFEAEYTYSGDDLGAVWTAEQTTFKVWAPTADAVSVYLYESGHEGGLEDMLQRVPMEQGLNGTWTATVEGNLNGTYYTYGVLHGDMIVEACDPYARTTGVNGKRAMVIDLDSTDPDGWEHDAPPHASGKITDAVIYELHVRDLSSDASSGIANSGKFLGLIEEGTTNAAGIPTGLDHIKSLGVTHIHLLPSYDYASVDETDPDAPFNWGYDPVNYNVPEGSYSTDPYHGEVRVKEFKQMVQGLHNQGIGVILDVVYNHVYSADDFCFNNIVPGYFSRISADGVYSNGSICGNDTASERSMVRKYIVDSVKYWADEYHLDGFRFDLAGLIDSQTINEVIDEVHKTHPHVIFYAEGWTMSTILTRDDVAPMATQANSDQTPGMAYFSDTIRDALRGSNSNASKQGFAAGAGGFSSNIKESFLGNPTWAKSPSQVVNYASCHDGYTLFDRIVMSTRDDTLEDQIRMNNLAAAVYMTSQGVSFVHAGEEMLRSKPLGDGSYDHNSYKSSDEINSIKWDNLSDPVYQDVVEYYRGLIAFRKAHPALRLTTAEEVEASVTALGGLDFNVLAFDINTDIDDRIMVVFNPNRESTTVTLPEGQWSVCINGEDAGLDALAQAEGSVEVAAISAMVLTQENPEKIPVETVPGDGAQVQPMPEGGKVDLDAIALVLLSGAAIAVVAVILNKKERH